MSIKQKFPDINGFFGEYGGKFVPETLMYALEELEDTYSKLKDSEDFKKEFYADLSNFVGRPSPLSVLLCIFRKIFLHEIRLYRFFATKLSTTG